MAKAFAASKLFGVQNPIRPWRCAWWPRPRAATRRARRRTITSSSGRPAKKADAMLRDFLSAGGKVEWHALTDDQGRRHVQPSGRRLSAHRLDAGARQGRRDRNPMWKKYPRQMLRSRVVSEGVRTVCPGATSGMYVPEEVQDIVHDEPQRADRANNLI
jgi:hypothetical protein